MQISLLFPQIPYPLTFKILSYILSIIFSLLSTATVVYTVTCIYTTGDVSFKHVISVIPNVWKRLLITYLCVHIGLFAYTFVATMVFSLILMVVVLTNESNAFSSNSYSLTFAIIVTIIVFMGTFYLTLIWRLSYAVSILEEFCGFKAMAKSKGLVQGKMMINIKLSMFLILSMGGFELGFYYMIFHTPLVGKILLEIVLVVLFSFFFLFGLVAMSVFYFVCKSYHLEIVDKLSGSDHLQSYPSVEYYPLKVDDHTPIEKLQVVTS
ncbi:hypothetical protein SDJN03_01038, partial [Cucurbita argyrosperma subsp. sororia]